MAGIYIHIPFCRQACHYCNFHFSTSLRGKNDLLSALLNEIGERRDYLSGQRIDTIYFGGGTPSILSAEELYRIIDAIEMQFDVDPAVERTLEANPDDVSNTLSRAWRELGINRISLGVQSFQDKELRWMNRAHDASQAVNSIEILRREGFENITADLIYGSPLLDDQQWKENLDRMIAFGIPHLSCYALTVEPKTALAHQITSEKNADVDPDRQAIQFEILMDTLSGAGFEHYEISNFAKPGYRSRHNSSYWQGAHYLGIGPAAHSYNGVERRWNIANNAAYISGILSGNRYWEEEVLTESNRLNEYIMTALRLQEGISTERIVSEWGQSAAESLSKQADRFISEGLLEKDGSFIRLTRAGKFLADGIAAEMFV